MGVTFFSARKYNTKLKVTIQSTGKLGFTDETAKELQLASGKCIKLGSDEKGVELLYLVVVNGADEDAFRVCKAGDYFYLQTTMLFQSLNYDYKNKTVMFDMARAQELDEELGGEVYKLTKREIIKRDKK